MKIYVADKETGTFIEEVESIYEGEKLIDMYEEQDKIDGSYEDDFYDIVNENRESLIY